MCKLVQLTHGAGVDFHVVCCFGVEVLVCTTVGIE